MGPQSWSLLRHFQKFTSSGGRCAKVRCASSPETILFCTEGGPLADSVLSLGQSPTLMPPAALGPHPKKVFPQFPKILRGQGENFDCVIRMRWNFGNCTLAQLPAKKFQSFDETCQFLELREISPHKKSYVHAPWTPLWYCHGAPPAVEQSRFFGQKSLNPIGPNGEPQNTATESSPSNSSTYGVALARFIILIAKKFYMWL